MHFNKLDPKVIMNEYYFFHARAILLFILAFLLLIVKNVNDGRQ